MEKLEDKNPKNNTGKTPLHFAAQEGHLAVCQFIIEKVEEKNPKDNSGETPLRLATRNNHADVFLTIFKVLRENNSNFDLNDLIYGWISLKIIQFLMHFRKLGIYNI